MGISTVGRFSTVGWCVIIRLSAVDTVHQSTYTHTHIHTDIHTHIDTDTQTDRQTQTDTDKHRQTDRDTQTDTDTQTDEWCASQTQRLNVMTLTIQKNNVSVISPANCNQSGPNFVHTCTDQAATTITKLWVQSAKWGQKWRTRTSHIQPVFDTRWHISLTSQQALQPNLPTTRESTSPQNTLEGMFKNFPFMGQKPHKPFVSNLQPRSYAAECFQLFHVVLNGHLLLVSFPVISAGDPHTIPFGLPWRSDATDSAEASFNCGPMHLPTRMKRTKSRCK